MSDLRRPVLMVNFKAYPQVEGKGAVALALECERVAEEAGVCVAVCPPVVETSAVAAAVDVPVLSQTADALSAGSRTGWVTPTALKACGCAGTLLNHSEHMLGMKQVADAVAMCREAGLATVVCADSDVTASAAAETLPDFVAVEPPELIGGDVSVTAADPEIVSRTVARVRRVDGGIGVLCGAGVKTSKDVAKALELGADGVLLASGVVKAADWHSALAELASGFRNPPGPPAPFTGRISGPFVKTIASFASVGKSIQSARPVPRRTDEGKFPEDRMATGKVLKEMMEHFPETLVYHMKRGSDEPGGKIMQDIAGERAKARKRGRKCDDEQRG